MVRCVNHLARFWQGSGKVLAFPCHPSGSGLARVWYVHASGLAQVCYVVGIGLPESWQPSARVLP